MSAIDAIKKEKFLNGLDRRHRNVRIRQPCWAVVVLDDHDFAPFDGFAEYRRAKFDLSR